MHQTIYCFQSEWIKYAHSPLIALHFLLPAIFAIIFAAYFHVSIWDHIVKVSAFLETMAVCFPFIIGIIAGMVGRTEHHAGNFQLMLGTIPSRTASFTGKLCFLLFLGFCGILIALTVFVILFHIEPPVPALKNGDLSQVIPHVPILYLKAAGLLFLSVIPLYLIHLPIGFCFGQGASMGLGITGSLFSALMLTGLGDSFWKYIPWAWGVRFMDVLVLAWSNPQIALQYKSEVLSGLMAVLCFTALLFSGNLIWMWQWDGNRTDE